MHDDEPTSIQPTPADSASTFSGIAQLHPGDQVGHYKILEQIGEGGFAIVYLAEQAKPVRRRVALKIIKLGMDTKQVIARFEAERQALAMMDHPNVAKVFDAGATETGRPYFAMEHVPGTPITEHSDRQRLDIEQRLGLFMQVCDAIQHAHQKGIIHRDLKPSNVLVSVSASKPLVKVIDFGVAKAIGQRLTEQTIYTEQGQLIGTPEYMSPEQAEMTADDIDTRSDIYSLGVLLYELLTGALPFDPRTLRKAAFGEIQRIIREEEPPKPSTRLSSLGDDSATSAKRRRVDPKSLYRELRGDLDWIVMKALEKDRSRRYETANGLATDIRRHMDHQPVLAGPPSAAYKLRKFARRNRVAVVAASVVAVSLIAAAAVSVVFGLSESRQRRVATTKADIAQAVNDFLNNDLLAAVAPSAEPGKGREVLMRDVLDQAADRIEEASAADGRFGDKPLVEASIRDALGDTYEKLGEYPAAEPHLERARALRRRVLGEEHPDTLKAMNNLAGLYHKQGRYDEAEALYLETFELGQRILGEEHPDTLMFVNNLAVLYMDQGRFDEAQPLYLETLEIHQRVRGEEHPQTLKSMNNLALLYWNLGRYDEAQPLYLRTLEIKKRTRGEEHPDTLLSMKNLASLYHRQGRHDEAEPLYQRTVEIHKRVHGEGHPDTLRAMNDLASLYHEQGRYDEAQPLYLATVAGFKRVLGDEHPKTLVSMSNLALLYRNQDRNDEAEPLHLATLEIQKRVLGQAHPDTLLSMTNLAELYHDQGRYDDAAALFEATVVGARQTWPQRHWITGAILGYYANTLIELRRYQEAETKLLEAHEFILAGLGPDHERTHEQIASFANLYDAWGKPEEAAEWRAKLPAEQDAVASDHPEPSQSPDEPGE